MRRRATELQRISADEFVQRLKHTTERPDQRYALFLGAGCSITSGIPAAGRLVRDPKASTDWLRRLRDVRSPNTPDGKLDEWARTELSAWNSLNPGASYGELIEKLFLSAGDRQREIERLCVEGFAGTPPFPDFGYAVLSSLMCHKDGRFNVALTTNFDDLLIDAFFYFQEVRPLVIHHDSLAPFIRPTHSRPLIVKVHGDHRLSPRNTEKEIVDLPETVSQRVSNVVHDRGVIFVGYGGNDESIIKMMEALPDEALPFGVYWISGDEPRGIFRHWLESRGAVWVAHQDFDELMFRFKDAFKIEEPKRDRFDGVHARYRETHKAFLKGIVARPEKAGEDSLLKAALANAVSQTEPEFAKSLFETAIKESPHSCDLHLLYANFLENQLRDLDRAEELYKKAIEADPQNAVALTRYANFLSERRRNLDGAEDLLKRAIEAHVRNPEVFRAYASIVTDDGKHPGSPEGDVKRAIYRQAITFRARHTSPLTIYGHFLAEKRRNMELADSTYRKAVDANPKDANTLRLYASFLAFYCNDERRAEELYRRAIETNPSHAASLFSYAWFLADKKRDVDRADEYYKLAAATDTKDAAGLRSYAWFLANTKGDLDRADEYYRKAINADPKDATSLRGYAWFLADKRGDVEGAETYYAKSIDSTPDQVASLFHYAWFLAYKRKDIDRADELYRKALLVAPQDATGLVVYAEFLTDELNDLNRAVELYEKAVEAAPNDASIARAYAWFLANKKNDLDRAEEYYKRAAEADPNDPYNLRSYAWFLTDKRNDLAHAEELYGKLVKAHPEDATILGNYAHFLNVHRSDAARAEDLYRKSIKARPHDANTLGNYAQLLFGQGRTSDGLRVLADAWTNLAKSQVPELEVELLFYGYAHGPDAERQDCLRRLKKTLQSGTRSTGWSFAVNVERATKIEKHPAKRWLAKLAAVCSDEADIATLESWKAWREV